MPLSRAARPRDGIRRRCPAGEGRQSVPVGLCERNADDGGFTLIEITLAVSLLVVGALGFLSAVVGTQLVTRSNRELNIANAAIINQVEDLRAACAADFDATVNAYVAGVVAPPAALFGLGGPPVLTARAIVDETVLLPPIDLNGDGDFTDTNVAVPTLRAAVVEVEVTWTGVLGARSLVFKTILARGQV